MWLLPLETTFNHETWNLLIDLEISSRTITKSQTIFNTNRAKNVVTICIFYPEENTSTQMMHKNA